MILTQPFLADSAQSMLKLGFVSSLLLIQIFAQGLLFIYKGLIEWLNSAWFGTNVLNKHDKYKSSTHQNIQMHKPLCKWLWSKTLTIACFGPRLVLAYLCDPNPHGNLCCTAKPPMSEMWKYAASKNISSGPNSAPSQPGQVLSWSSAGPGQSALVTTVGHHWHHWALALNTCVGQHLARSVSTRMPTVV